MGDSKNKRQSIKALDPARRSSMFEVPLPGQQEPAGISVVSLSIEPDQEELARFQVASSNTASVENTYRMEPSRKFRSDLVIPIIEQTLDEHLSGKTYSIDETNVWAKMIAQDIKRRTKDLKFKRYKYVSVVTIGDKLNHDVRIASRSLWDPKTDSFATAVFENGSLYAVGTLYGLYYE